MPSKFPWFGLGLILVGVVMLLERTGNFSLGWPLAFWILLTLYGAYRLTRGLRGGGEKGGVFWGMIFFGIGLYNVLADLGTIWVPNYILYPSVIMLVGAAFLALWLTQRRNWHILIPAVALILAGGLMLLDEFGYIRQWDVYAMLSNYWPILLVLFGVALLLNRRTS